MYKLTPVVVSTLPRGSSFEQIRNQSALPATAYYIVQCRPVEYSSSVQ